MASIGIGTIVSYALTAYSAVSAIKALKDGNLLGAVMGGFGAYMGISNLASSGAFGTQVAGDATQLSAEMGGQTFAKASGAGFLESANVGSEIFNTGSGAALGGVNDVVGSVTGSGLLSGAGAAITPQAVAPATKVPALNTATGVKNPSGWDKLIQTGKGVVNEVGDLMSMGGKVIAKAGEAVGGMDNLIGIGKMGAAYLMEKEKQEEQLGYLEDAEKRKRQDVEATRSRMGAAPTYVYDFGRGR